MALMGRRKRRSRTRTVQNLKIEKIASEGKGLGRDEDGKVIFVDYALPGDVVNTFVYKSKKDVGIGRIDELISPSELRIDSFCEHFQVCGGCRWQHVSYDNQLAFKHNTVVEAFERIAKVPHPTVPEVIGSENTTEYRNKLEFTFSNSRWLTNQQIQSGKEFDKEHALGFHIPTFFDKIVDINKCYLQNDFVNTIRNTIREYTIEQNYSYFDIRNHHGLMRNLIVRNSTLGEWMVIVCFYEPDEERILQLMTFLKDRFPEITSLNYIINQKPNDSIFDQEVICFSGTETILEKLDHCQFKIGPKSFFQPNPKQAEKLYRLTEEYAELTGNEVVYDLFTGTGTIANYVAHKAKKVVGIEIIPEAIEDAKINAKLNQNENCEFIAGKVEDLFTDELLAKFGQPDVVILDPPRAGIHKDVAEQLLKLGTDRIVYVSCNPATQARDVSLLSELYTVEKIQPVDLFPQTYHIENIIQLKKKQ